MHDKVKDTQSKLKGNTVAVEEEHKHKYNLKLEMNIKTEKPKEMQLELNKHNISITLKLKKISLRMSSYLRVVLIMIVVVFILCVVIFILFVKILVMVVPQKLSSSYCSFYSKISNFQYTTQIDNQQSKNPTNLINVTLYQKMNRYITHVTLTIQETR